MAKLYVDMDALSRTVSVYDTELNNIEAAKKSVRSALGTLRSSGWNSSAGAAWFKLLDDEWLRNIDRQIRILERLRDNLSKIAKPEYERVYEEQQNLKNCL